MENDQDLISAENNLPVKSTLKRRFLVFLVVIILSAGIYFFFWLRTTFKMRNEASQVLQQVEDYKKQKGEIEAELARCRDFIIKQEGDFSSFEYCKKFIDWAEKL